MRALFCDLRCFKALAVVAGVFAEPGVLCVTTSVGINKNGWSLVQILFGMNFLFKSLHVSSKQ